MIASQGGINFYIGNHAEADGVSASMPEPYGHNWRIRDISYIAERSIGTDLKPGEISAYWYARAWDWIMAHPAQASQLYLKKLYRFVSNDEVSNNRSMHLFFDRMTLLRLNPLRFAAIFGFGVLGILLGFGTNRKISVLAGIIIVYMLAGALFFFSSRFRLPLMPYFFVLAAGGAGGLLERAVRRSSTIAASIVVLILAWAGSHMSLVALPPGISAMGHVSQGLHYYNLGDYETARDIFQQARVADSAFPEANLNLGATYLRLGRLDSAKYFLHQELAINPGRPKTYVNLASIALLDERLDSAALALQPALATFPYDITAQRLQLRVAAALSISNDSLYNLALSAAEATNGARLLVNEAAIMLTNRGGLDQARQLLRLTLGSSPPPIEMDDRMFEADYLSALRKDRNQVAQAEYQLGYVEALTGDHLSAVTHSRRAITIDSSISAAHVNLISSLLSLGEMAQARTALDRAQLLFPDDPNIDRLGHNIRKTLR